MLYALRRRGMHHMHGTQGLFWIVIWLVIIVLVGCVVQRLGLCYPFCKMFGCAKCAFKHCRGNKK
jgi:hypothetical protein